MTIDKQNNKHCEGNEFKRLRYFHGMLIEDTDFKAEQVYHMEKRKLLNRSLHGWGVVCGLGIKLNNEKTKITIEPGFALDCHGREIVVCKPCEIPITSIPCLCPKPTAAAPRTPEDCKKLLEREQGPKTCYIGIRYDEIKDDPVPVYTPSGGCEEKACDYSRIREGFCIDFFDELPEQPMQTFEPTSLAKLILNANENGSGELDRVKSEWLREGEINFNRILSDGTFTTTLCRAVPSCPDCCPSEHYVILGTVKYEYVQRMETWQFNEYPNEKRQYVLSASLFKYLFKLFCEDGATELLKLRTGDLEDMPDVNLLHENPIAALCWLAKYFTAFVLRERRANPKVTFQKMTYNDAAKHLQSELQLNVLESALTLTDANKDLLINRSFDLGLLTSSATRTVQIVVDKDKNPLFYLPVKEEIDLGHFKKELDKNLKEINQLKAEINKLKVEKKAKAETQKTK